MYLLVLQAIQLFCELIAYPTVHKLGLPDPHAPIHEFIVSVGTDSGAFVTNAFHSGAVFLGIKRLAPWSYDIHLHSSGVPQVIGIIYIHALIS